MTNPFYGSSLFQAPRTDHVHQHSHLHNRTTASTHARSHAEFHNHRRDETADLDSRDITEVVQTISVIQIIDGTGAIISAQILQGSPQTNVVDSDTGLTVAVNNNAVTTTSASTNTDITAIISADPVSATPTSFPPTDSTISPATDTSVPAGLSVTQIPSSSSLPASFFSSFSSSANSTSPSFTSSLTDSSSILPLSLPSTPATTALSSSGPDPSGSQSGLSSLLPSSFASTTFASSTISSTSNPSSVSTPSSRESSSTQWLSSSITATPTGTGSAGSGVTATDAGTASTSAASGSSSDDAESAQTSKVAGGIVGGIAGLALLAALAFMLLRMKKRGSWCHLRLGAGADEPNAAARQALPAPSAGGGGGGGGTDATPSSAYGTMQQRSAAPQGVAASLAALAGKRSSRERAGSGEMAERGFVRVSGKKLPPVLQYGGDGYSDPRETRLSDTSASIYRDSIAVFDQPNHRPLALGSPMRPESGIMTMHPGPARTPVTSSVPSRIESPVLPRSSTFPTTEALGRTLESEGFSRDAIGRTLAIHDQSHDGSASRGSRHSRGSTRFTEHVA